MKEANMQTTSTGVTQVCVIYDPSDGKIIHIHSETFAPAMEQHSEEEMENRARNHAQKAKRTVTDAKALHLRDPQFTGWPKRVDPKTRQLEVTEPRSLGKPSGTSTRD
jgi:hypothetical protein